ncbi:MAG: FtsK/SpoIIIE domain-containing protein, partial [Microbacterium sp.]
MEPLTIALPAPTSPPRRQPLPLIAAVIPIVAGVVLWMVTGSVLSLCFAALGPLMLGASLLEGLRTRARDRRRSTAESEAVRRRAEADLERLHAAERAELWRRNPDVVGCLAEPPLRGPDPPDAASAVVVGRGGRASAVRVTGADDEGANGFRERAAVVSDAPVVVPLGRGICIRAPRVVGAAVLRALTVQLCLRFSPAQLSVHGEGLEGWGLDALPHALTSRRAAFRVAVGSGGGVDADAVLCVCDPDAGTPDGITTVLDCTDPLRARLRTADGVQEIAVDVLSCAQAMSVARGIPRSSGQATEASGPVTLGDLGSGGGGVEERHGLPALLGRTDRGDLLVDLVEDGPHAIVTGMTGTGKSELLVSWVSAIAALHGPDRVAFVLADFKGGTAFDRLRGLPQVAAVITDLDGGGARRGVLSLRAELRRREGVLADVGVRDIRDHPALARLVIVVDEFAALLQEHPDLAAVFTDVAARGRALGMHLVLGTQRASGVIRDALAANCPLRIALRVTDPADSRLVIGSDAAAELPGGAGSRGLALVRRQQDVEAAPARIALTTPTDLQAIAARWGDAPAAPSPWLPALPRRLPLSELLAEAADVGTRVGSDPAASEPGAVGRRREPGTSPG